LHGLTKIELIRINYDASSRAEVNSFILVQMPQQPTDRGYAASQQWRILRRGGAFSHCPLLSESGQTRARLDCPLTASLGEIIKSGE
jgi:hypothetical protein